MIKRISNLNSVLTNLKSDGVCVIDDYTKGDELSNLREEVVRLCETRGEIYEFGKNYRGSNLLSHKTHAPHIFNAFDKSWMKELNKNYQNQRFCENIFGTHDYKVSTNGSAANGWLHFDKRITLKFLIYLTHVNRSNGVFYCSPGSHLVTPQLRKEIKDYKKERRLKLNFPTIVEQYPPEPVIGKAGTLIVFDTDVFHLGGKVEDGKERVVIRGHCIY